jgi:DNA ligase-1
MNSLYKIDSKQNLRVINYWTEGEYLCQSAGLYEGSLVENRKACKGKNIGKSNETTPEQQAISEMLSKIQEKISEGYCETIEKAENSTVILPMLAKDYKKESHKIDWNKPVFVQPKLDGMRCLAFINKDGVRLQSRDGKTISTVPHINKALLNIRDEIVLDGELYCHGKSFQENMSLIKKYVEGETEQIKFVIYDCILPNAYSYRIQHVEHTLTYFECPYIEIIPCFEITVKTMLNTLHSKIIEQGYEGSIVRWGNEGYQKDARSQYLLKYKDFLDITATILDVVPSNARPEQGVLVCELSNNKQFRASLKFSHKQREEILSNKMDYVGKTAEIRFFEYTDDGLPRFPVCVGFRLDK